MPHFEDFYAAKLRGSLGVTDAESVLDLRGSNRPTAEASLADMLERSRFGKGKTVAIRLDPPPEGGGAPPVQAEASRHVVATARKVMGLVRMAGISLR